MKHVTVLAATFGVGLAVAVPTAQGPVFRGTSQTVPIYATVTDASGRLVPDLVEEHFEIYDNLVKQPITVFRSDVQPITVAMMLDTSGSMTASLDFLKDAAERFVLRLLPEDRARIGAFSDKIQVSPRFTNDRDELVRYIHNDTQFGNGTFLWDAIDTGMSALADETGRRVVLVFTDGQDEKSERTNFDQVLARARNQDFMIYAIGFHNRLGTRSFSPDRNLRQLAELTGGGFFELRRTADLNSTFTRVADELHRQYVLGFAIDKLDGQIHKLDVRVKVPGMTVRARKTYVASATGEPDPAALKRSR
jgi:Ca-activated chloride channel family protein